MPIVSRATAPITRSRVAMAMTRSRAVRAMIRSMVAAMSSARPTWLISLIFPAKERTCQSASTMMALGRQASSLAISIRCAISRRSNSQAPPTPLIFPALPMPSPLTARRAGRIRLRRAQARTRSSAVRAMTPSPAAAAMTRLMAAPAGSILSISDGLRRAKVFR